MCNKITSYFPPATQSMKCDEAAKMFIWCILIQVNERGVRTLLCGCVCGN